MKSLLAWALVLATCTVPAMADNPTGPYIGGGFGRFHLDIDSLRDVGEAVDSVVNSNDDAYKVFVGWRLVPFLAVEAAYVNLGHPSDGFVADGSYGEYRVHMQGFSPTLLGTLPLGPVEVFGEVGYFFYNVDLTADFNAPFNQEFESTHTRSDFLYGGGVGVTILDHLNLRAEYQQLDLTRYQNSDALWLDASWRF